MKGDLSRSTWAPRKHYSSVRSQQGRVQLDADWNEQADIQDHLRETGVADAVGPCGVPERDPGFGIGIVDGGGDLTISSGRIYVDGILCELEADADPVTYLSQPDYPGAQLPSELEPEPLAGVYLAYLDVWRRHVTVIEDPGIRERALGGPDTATRLKTVAQVKLLSASEAGEDLVCSTALPAWNALTAPSSGVLRARTQPGVEEDDPCVVPASAGYTRLENQLYRIEIHDAGELGEATFKWSRNNGSLATEWLGQDETDPNLLRVGSTGRDKLEELQNVWVEITDDDRDLRGETGQLVRALVATGDTIEIDPEGETIDFSSAGPNPKIRRWDQPVDADGALGVEIAGDNQGYLRIESGIEIRFEAGTYRTGDYWLIPARAFVGEFAGDIEWPEEAPGQGVARPPAGIEHHYCRLGLVEFDGEQFVGEPTDCRRRFPALTELTSFFKIGGEGQSALPGRVLPCPLAVGVRNGEWPVPGVEVEFSVASFGGTLVLNDGTTGSAVTATTNEFGFATCAWMMPETPPGTEANRQCLSAGARLVDDSLVEEATPLFFTAEVAVAREVGYDPSECPPLAEAGAFTVQDAIDALCERLGASRPGIGIEEIRLVQPDRTLQFEAEVEAPDLANGLAIRCDRELAPEAFAAPTHDLFAPARPNCTLSLDIPYPLGEAAGFWDVGQGSVGFQRITLAARVNVDDDTIFWSPTGEASNFLAQRLLGALEDGIADRVLAHLTLKGNFVWSEDDDGERRLYVDGDVYGTPVDGDRVHGRFPTGNGVPGGDFEMWFWVLPAATVPTPGLSITAIGRTGSVIGVLRSGDDRVPGVPVTLFDASGQTRTAVTNANGEFTFGDVAPGQYLVRATVGGQTAEAPVTVRGTATPRPTGTVRPDLTISPTFQPELTVSPTFRPDRTFRPTATLRPSPTVGGGGIVVAGGGFRGLAAADDPTTRVSGIGPVRSSELEAAGIASVRELAAADPAAVAAALGLSDEAAAEFVDAARALLPPGSGRPTTEVNGIGEVTAGRLSEGGIRDLAELAAAEPATVAEVLSISEVRAMGMVEAARGLVDG